MGSDGGVLGVAGKKDGCRDHLRDAMVEKTSQFKANITTQLWRVAKNVLPSIVQDLLSQVERERGFAGRSQVDFFRLLNLIEARINELYYWPDCFGSAIASRFGYSSIEDAAEALRVAGDTLYAEMHSRQMFARRPKRLRKVGLGVCELCWRFVPAHRAGKYFCRFHVPLPSNTAYKSAKALSIWREDGRKSSPITVGVCLRATRSSLSTRLDILDHRLADIGDAPSEEPSVVSVAQPLDGVWAKLPWTAAYLRNHGLDVETCCVAQALTLLDPVDAEHQKTHLQIHELLVADQRLFAGMLVSAEAWLTAHAIRRGSWGGHRRHMVPISDSQSSEI